MLCHFVIYSRTAFEQQREELYEVNFDNSDNSEKRRKLSTVGPTMLAQLLGGPFGNKATSLKAEKALTDKKKQKNKTVILHPDRPRVDFSQLQHEVDPFLDPSLIELFLKDQEEKVVSAVHKTLYSAQESEFPLKHCEELQQIVYEILDQFQDTFSPMVANIAPLQFKLHLNAKAVTVMLRNFYKKQRIFMNIIMSQLSDNGIIYRNKFLCLDFHAHVSLKTWFGAMLFYCLSSTR